MTNARSPHNALQRMFGTFAMVSLLSLSGSLITHNAEAAPMKREAKQKAKPKQVDTSPEALRKRVGEYAATLVKNGDRVGLGTGRTVNEFIRALGRRVANEGLQISTISSSVRSTHLARRHGMSVRKTEDVAALDIAIDGADEVDPSLDLVKGLGGALLRERIVASKAKRFVVIVDEGKLVSTLGRGLVPVEVDVAKVASVQSDMGKMGIVGTLRLVPGTSNPYVTDNGNHIVDMTLPSNLSRGSKAAKKSLDSSLRRIPGVIDHGLFLDSASEVIISHANGEIETKSR